MKSFTNIEKSAFKRGQYVGYCAGRVYAISRTNSTYGNWIAWEANGATAFYAFTLAQMSAKLTADTDRFNVVHLDPPAVLA